MWAQSHRKGSASAEWLQYWKIQKLGDIPPVAPTIPRNLEYIYTYVHDKPYVLKQKLVERPKAFRKRVYDTMHIVSRADREQQEISVVKQNPATNWKRVWANIHDACTAETITAVWYVIIHDIHRRMSDCITYA
jgi:hypothetical protein